MTDIIAEDEIYIYEILQEKHLDESSKLLGNSFAKYNPLEIYMKITYDKLYDQALTLSKAVLLDRLSIVAINKHTKEIHAVVQAGEEKTVEAITFQGTDLKDDSSEVYAVIEQQFKQHYGEFKINEMAHIMMAGVHPDCSGKGLCTSIHRILLDYCRQRGFKHVIVEVTNPVTYHIYTKKLNGKEFTTIHLPTFVTSDGRKPFEHYDAHMQLIVFDL